MKKPDTTLIDQDWPVDELEEVHSCPYCGSTDRAVAYKNVQDWSFYCAPGKWTYWDCMHCDALYLNPRPTEISVGKAYASYYTHAKNTQSLFNKLIVRLKNELYSNRLNLSLLPRFDTLRIPKFLINSLNNQIHMPYEFEFLSSAPKGSLLDVGCGSGETLKFAKHLGFKVTGLEVDSAAVSAARALGLDIIEGDYRQMLNLKYKFDYIVCSHVLEHVHEPVLLLELLSKALKPNGLLLLSFPNAISDIRFFYGENWRGLEAPRHISIACLKSIENILTNIIRFKGK